VVITNPFIAILRYRNAKSIADDDFDFEGGSSSRARCQRAITKVKQAISKKDGYAQSLTMSTNALRQLVREIPEAMKPRKIAIGMDNAVSGSMELSETKNKKAA
jgi:hypothetical protein